MVNLSFFVLLIWAFAFITHYLLKYPDLQNFISLLHSLSMLYSFILLKFIQVLIYSQLKPLTLLKIENFWPLNPQQHSREWLRTNLGEMTWDLGMISAFMLQLLVEKICADRSGFVNSGSTLIGEVTLLNISLRPQITDRYLA